MTETAADEQIGVKLALNDEEVAKQIKDWLRDQGVTDLEETHQFGVAPILPIVIAASVAVSTSVALAIWIQKAFGCNLTIDAHGDDIKKDIDCEHRRGETYVFTRDHVKVTVVETKPALDLTKFFTKVVTGGSGDEVKEEAEKAGAKVETSPISYFPE
jgi:hypothetical protein